MNKMTVNAVEEFKKLWIKGMESLYNACKVYVAAIESNPDAKNDFKKAFPQINAAAWGMIESVGRGNMHHALLLDSTSGGDKLRKMPYSEQQKAIDCGFEVLTENGDTLKVKMEDLTPELSKQVFSRDHIRDIAAQKAYRESLKIEVKMKIEKPKELWKVKGKNLEVFAPSSFSREQLLRILQDMC